MRQIPPITKNLLIINVLAFLSYYVLGMQGINLNGPGTPVAYSAKVMMQLMEVEE